MMVVDLVLSNRVSRRHQPGQEGRGRGKRVDTTSQSQRKKGGAVRAWCVASVDASLKPRVRARRERGSWESKREKTNQHAPEYLRPLKPLVDRSRHVRTSSPILPRLARPLVLGRRGNTKLLRRHIERLACHQRQLATDRTVSERDQTRSSVSLVLISRENHMVVRVSD